MPGYALKFETVQVGGEHFRMRSLLDRQQYCDDEGDAERAGISTAAWPLFGLLWPASLVLAHAMLVHEIAGLRILEVGCGLALASLVLHRRHADITASDRHPLAGVFLQANLRLNAMPPLPYADAHWSRPMPGLGRFDLIVGSDVLYERGHSDALTGFIEQHAKADAQVLIVDANRGYRAGFTKLIAADGFARHVLPMRGLPGGNEAFRGQLLDFRRGGTTAPG